MITPPPLPGKDYGMHFKMCKMTPWCSKQVPGEESTWESWLTPEENTRDNLCYPVVNTLGSLDSTVMNTPGNLKFLDYVVSASELFYKKITAILHCRESRLHCVFITGESWCLDYSTPSSIFAQHFLVLSPGSHDLVMNTAASRWQIQITPGTFDTIQNPF